jgi:hypothetical protein
LGQVISTLARRGLRAQIAVARKNGLPVFKVTPDAPIISDNQAAELLAEEES